MDAFDHLKADDLGVGRACYSAVLSETERTDEWPIASSRGPVRR